MFIETHYFKTLSATEIKKYNIAKYQNKKIALQKEDFRGNGKDCGKGSIIAIAFP
ncbi:MAG: hypothetical protein ACFFAN_10160 [Promethearchaeota archaeon]